MPDFDDPRIARAMSELERDMEYFVEPDEAPLAPRTGDLE